MPSKRYLLVEGVRDEHGNGHPVTDPHSPSASPARYAGWQFAPKLKPSGDGAEDVDSMMDHYQPTRQVIVDHVDLRAAIAKGHLKLHGECVAKDHDDAAGKFNKVTHAKPTKHPGGEK